jgi:hypothetical protein
MLEERLLTVYYPRNTHCRCTRGKGRRGAPSALIRQAVNHIIWSPVWWTLLSSDPAPTTVLAPVRPPPARSSALARTLPALPKGIPRPHLRAPLDFLCAPPNLRTCIPGCAQFITQLGPFWSAVRSAVDGPYLSLSRSVLASAPLRPLRPLLVTYISLSLSAPLLGVRRGYCVSSL